MRPPKTICYDCIHFRGAKAGKCDAYPEEIPEKIWAGRLAHREPFPGDQGIRFEPKTDEFLTIYEAAKLLRVNPKTIYRALWAKKVPAYKIGKAWRIAKRDIERFRS